MRALTERDQVQSWFPSDVIVSGGEWKAGASVEFPFPPEVLAKTLTGEFVEVDEPNTLVSCGARTRWFELTSGGGRKALHPDRRAAPGYCGAGRVETSATTGLRDSNPRPTDGSGGSRCTRLRSSQRSVRRKGRRPDRTALEGGEHGRSQDRNTRGVARGTRGPAQAREGAHPTRRRDRAPAADLPWVPVAKDYRFDTDEGEKSLEDLFDGRSQLLVYHFMFGPSYQAGCPVNSSIADSLDGALPHLHARDATLLLVSQAPLEKLQAYKRRMGWRLPWVSSSPGDFNFDLGFSQTEEQSRQAVAQVQLPRRALERLGSSPTRTGTRSRRSSSRTPARRVPTSVGTSPRAPGSAPSYETAMTSTTRTRRRGADWSSS